jgi:hypothetical protein
MTISSCLIRSARVSIVAAAILAFGAESAQAGSPKPYGYVTRPTSTSQYIAT